MSARVRRGAQRLDAVVDSHQISSSGQLLPASRRPSARRTTSSAAIDCACLVAHASPGADCAAAIRPSDAARPSAGRDAFASGRRDAQPQRTPSPRRAAPTACAASLASKRRREPHPREHQIVVDHSPARSSQYVAEPGRSDSPRVQCRATQQASPGVRRCWRRHRRQQPSQLHRQIVRCGDDVSQESADAPYLMQPGVRERTRSRRAAAVTIATPASGYATRPSHRGDRDHRCRERERGHGDVVRQNGERAATTAV